LEDFDIIDIIATDVGAMGWQCGGSHPFRQYLLSAKDPGITLRYTINITHKNHKIK
jgi:hypothetical protein